MSGRTLAEVLADAVADHTDLSQNDRRFGRWTWHPSDQTLEHDNGYWWQCAKFRSSAPVLDAIAQIAAKRRFTAEDVGDFVRAIDRIFDIQVSWCCGGRDAECDPTAALRRWVQR